MDITSILTAAIAGAIQGITELLPVSSSGHLLLFSSLTDLDFTILGIAVLHLGTLGSILFVMKDSLKEALKPDVLIKLAISAAPAAVIGVLFLSIIENYLGDPAIVVASLGFWGIALVMADRYAKQTAPTVSSLSSITTKQALIVGIAQPLAFIPGTSRSGITTIAGITAGLDRNTALTFSFLSGIPLLAASGFYSLITLRFTEHLSTDEWALIIIATITSFIFGIIAAIALKKFIERSILTICGIYRIVLSIALILALYIL